MASAARIRIAATRKVMRVAVAIEPAAAVVMSLVPAASENTAPMTDAPVISPRLRARLSMPDVTPRSPGLTPDMTLVLLAVWKIA
jgi:hypothetical protein